MSKDKKKQIIKQIEELEKELEKLSIEETSLAFVKLLRSVLLTDKCYIVLQGHEEWQFSERYRISDISYNIRKKIIEVLEIIYDKPSKELEK